MQPYKCGGTVIVFNRTFNGDLTKYLIHAFHSNDNSHNYSELILSDNFNKQIKMIPLLILYITFGMNFNKSVNGLHSLLEELTFKARFNKQINYLPNSITKLIFGLGCN